MTDALEAKGDSGVLEFTGSWEITKTKDSLADKSGVLRIMELVNSLREIQGLRVVDLFVNLGPCSVVVVVLSSVSFEEFVCWKMPVKPMSFAKLVEMISRGWKVLWIDLFSGTGCCHVRRMN